MENDQLTKEKKTQHTLGLGFCDKCQWLHEIDTDKGTNFMGVRLCPLHASAPDLLEALKVAHAMLILMGVELKAHEEGRRIIDAIAKAEGGTK